MKTHYITKAMTTATVWATPMTRDQITAELTQINADNAAYGLSDGRATREAALRAGLKEIGQQEANQRLLERVEAQFEDPHGTARSASGTTHFVNSFGEPFCGTRADLGPDSPANGSRATCRKCQQAGDAAKAAGFPLSGGSAARR